MKIGKKTRKSPAVLARRFQRRNERRGQQIATSARRSIQNSVMILRQFLTHLDHVDKAAAQTPLNEAMRKMSAHVREDLQATITRLEEEAAKEKPNAEEAYLLFQKAAHHADATLEDMIRLRREQRPDLVKTFIDDLLAGDFGYVEVDEDDTEEEIIRKLVLAAEEEDAQEEALRGSAEATHG